MLLITCFTGSWLSWSELLAKWTYHSHTLIFPQTYILNILADSFYFCFPLTLYLLWDRDKALSPIFISDVKAMVWVLFGVWGCCQEDQSCLGVLSIFLYTSHHITSRIHASSQARRIVTFWPLVYWGAKQYTVNLGMSSCLYSELASEFMILFLCFLLVLVLWHILTSKQCLISNL